MGDDTVRINCINDKCGTFVMDERLNARYKRTGETFYCPAGHAQHYTGESTESKLKKKNKELKRKIERLEERVEKYRDHLSDQWDAIREKDGLIKSLEDRLLETTDQSGAVEVSEDRWMWACSCGSSSHARFDTKREAWQAYDGHRERMHEEAAAEA